MNKDRIEGAASQAKGKIKEVAGEVQNAIGGFKDAMKGK